MRFPIHIATDMMKWQLKNWWRGNERYPYVLMLEPLHTCNLACLGCTTERHTGKLKDRLSTLRVGDPLDKNTDVGAINSRAQLEKITELVQSGVDEGAELYQPTCDLPDRGWFFRPTLFTGVAQSHRIASEEIFGPVLSVLTFRTPDEAVEKANNTPYGLSAGIWTEKGSRILAMVKAMKAGVVWANTFNKFDPTSPFGGYKESGFGREGGVHGLHAYVRLEDR